MAADDEQRKGYRLAVVLMVCGGVLAVLLLVTTVFDAANGRLFGGGAAPAHGFRMLFALKHTLLVMNGIALLVFIVGLWQRKTWAFLGISVVAAICLALVTVQIVVVGYRPRGLYLSLVALLSILSVILSNIPALRAYVGAKPANHLREALKWAAAVGVVLTGIALASAIYVSKASALLRLQPYETLVHESRADQARTCNWLTTPRVCLPTRYVVRPSATGPIIQRGSPDDAIMLISENVWDSLASTFGFESGYSFQSTLWDTAYLPLLYAALKQAMYVEGMSVYRLRTDRVRSLIQLQQHDGSWQASATIYLPDGTSFELISAHIDKGRALAPLLAAISAY